MFTKPLTLRNRISFHASAAFARGDMLSYHYWTAHYCRLISLAIRRAFRK